MQNEHRSIQKSQKKDNPAYWYEELEILFCSGLGTQYLVCVSVYTYFQVVVGVIESAPTYHREDMGSKGFAEIYFLVLYHLF